MCLLKMLTDSITRSIDENLPIYLIWATMPDGETERMLQVTEYEDGNWDFKCDGPVVTVRPDGLETMFDEALPESKSEGVPNQ